MMFEIAIWVGCGLGKQLFIILPGTQIQGVSGVAGRDVTMKGKVASVVAVGTLLKSAV